MTPSMARRLHGSSFLLSATFTAFLAVDEVAGADWSMSGEFSQRFSADSNLGLGSGGESSPGYASTTDFALRLTAATKTTTWVFVPGLRGTLGDEDNVDLTAIRPRFSGSVIHRRERLSINGNASFVPEISTFRDDEDDTFVEREGLTFTARAGLGASYQLSQVNSLLANVFSRWRGDFEDNNETTLSYGASLGFGHRFNETTSTDLSYSITQFTREEGSDSLSQSVSLGLSKEVNTRLSVNGSAGVSFTTEEGGDTTPGFIGSLGTRYRIGNTSFALALSQGVDQGDRGDVASRISLVGSMDHRLNDRMRFNFGARLSGDSPLFADDGTDNRQSFALTPGFSYRVDPDWSLNLGYRLRIQRDDESDERVSNTLFVSFSRGFDFIR